MGRAWNGLALQTYFSKKFGDEQTSFKAHVLQWLNDIILEIGTAHEWEFLREKGKVLLLTTSEVQNLYPVAPTAATATIAAGGSLTLASVYSVVVTFIESVSGLETVAGTASGNVTAAGANLSIALTAIPVSTDSLVTGRKIYLKKDSGEYLYHTTISNNTATTATISTNATSTITPPEDNGIWKLDGQPFLESASRLCKKDMEQMRSLWQGSWSTGTPQFWAEFKGDKISVYPIPSSAVAMSFYYYKYPTQLFAEASSVPTIPIYLKNLLDAGMTWKAYEWRDRDGQEGKKANYYALLSNEISTKGRGSNNETRVRDVNGDTDGFEMQ
jgi:hypothetical protein